MERQKKYNTILNILLFLVMLVFFAYYMTIVFNVDSISDIFNISKTSGGSDLYQSLKQIGLIVALAGSIISCVGIGKATKGSMFRGLTLGFIIGMAVLTAIVLAMAP